jgi:hypothetical protein
VYGSLNIEQRDNHLARRGVEPTQLLKCSDFCMAIGPKRLLRMLDPGVRAVISFIADIKSLFNRTKRTHVISRTHTKMRKMRSPLIL